MKIEKDWLLELETRKKLYAIINKYPGIYIRELERQTSFTIGQLTYHLPLLVKANLVKEEFDGRFKRFYPLDLSNYDRKILSLLRRSVLRRIIILILENRSITNKKLSKNMSLSTSTVSWYIHKIKDVNLINFEKSGNEIVYSLKSEDEIIKVLTVYKESFLDKMVDRFIETWDR